MAEIDHDDAPPRRPLRILIGHLGEPDANSGAAGTNLAVATALRDAGHEVVTLWQADVGRRIRHHALYYALEAPSQIRAAVAAHLGKAQFDIVDFSQPHGYLAARYVRERHPDTRFVHFSHGFEGLVADTVRRYSSQFPLDKPQRSLVRRIGSHVIDWKLTRHQSWIARWAHGHVVSATPCADYLRQVLQVEAKRIATIAQAASPAFADAAADTQVRPAGLLHVAQFAWFKAPMVTAEVFRRVAVETEARLCWICDTRHHPEVRRLLGPAADRVELCGWIDQRELAARMQEFSVFLFPSFFEGFGKAFVEAMAAGMCVVATGVGGMRDNIRNGIDGVLHEAGDVEGLTRSCIDLLRGPARAKAIGEQAQRSAGTRTWADHARERASFYRVLLGQTQPSAVVPESQRVTA